MHKTKLKSIINKSNNEKNDYQYRYLYVLEENKNLKEKIYQIEALNKTLMEKIKELEISTENFEIQIQKIAKKNYF